MHIACTERDNHLETPRVSILVPCYNVEQFLPQCLQSLISQTLRDIEIICINDGSTDSTLSVMQEFKDRDSRIRIIDKTNSGYGASMNCGLASARGEYIGITESDDFASSGMYKKLYRTAQKHNLDIAKSNFYNYFNGKDHKEETFRGFPYRRVFDPADIPHILAPIPSVWAAIYRRSMIEEAGVLFNETPGASFQDTAFVLKCWFAARRAYLIPQAYLHYRNDNPNSSVKSSTKIYEICDEFSSVDSFMDSDPERRRKFIAEFNGHRFNTYRWNYNRIGREYHMEFAARIRDEMLRARERNELLEEGFFPDNWVWLQEILQDSNRFARTHPERFEVEAPEFCV